MSAGGRFPASEKRFVTRKFLIAILIAIVAAGLVYFWPAMRQLVFSRVFGSPREIVLPTLTDPDRIQAEAVKDIRLLEHWGNGTFVNLTWSPDERFFAASTSRGINIYDGHTFHLIRYIPLPLREINILAFSPESALLAVAARPGSILLVNLAKDEILQQWDLGQNVLALTYLKNGTLVCITDAQTGGNGRNIMMLEDDRWQVVKVLDNGFLLDTRFVPEEQAYVVYYEHSVRLVDPVSGSEQILPYTVPYGGDFLLADQTLIVVDRDNYRMSSYREGTLVSQVNLDGLFSEILASPDGKTLASLMLDPENSSGSMIQLWSIPELTLMDAAFVPGLSLSVVNHIVFMPGGDRLALLVSPSEIRIFPTNDLGSAEIVLKDPYASIADLAVTYGGEIRAVGCTGTVVDILELPSANPVDEWYFDEPACGQILANAVTVVIEEPYEDLYLYRLGETVTPQVIKGSCCSVFSPDGSVGVGSSGIASSGDPVMVTIWQKMIGLAQVWKFYNAGWDAFHVAVSPTGRYVAASGPSNTYLWVHGVRSIKKFPSLLSDIAFSPDESYLASADGILELETGQVIWLANDSASSCSRQWHSNPAFSPDGRILATGICGVLHFWRVSDGTLLGKLGDPDFTNQKLIFSPDGTFLAGLGEGFVNIWGIADLEH